MLVTVVVDQKDLICEQRTLFNITAYPDDINMPAATMRLLQIEEAAVGLR
jgi:hypothetical protein